MRNVQMDTSSIATALKVLAADERYKAKSEEVSSVVEFCNNLVLYNKIAYDGNVEERRLRNITDRVEVISGKLKSEKLQKKLYPIINEEETEKKIIKSSARDAAGFLGKLQGDEDFAVEVKERFKDSPMMVTTENLLELVHSAQQPDESQIERYLKDRSIRGGRFFWGLLSDPESFETLRQYQVNGVELTDDMLNIMFTNFRYRFAENRGQELLSHPGFDSGIYYHPDPLRMRFLFLFANYIEERFDRIDPWEIPIEPHLKKLIYKGEKAYLDGLTGSLYGEMETYVPILFNKVVTSIGDVTKISKADFLDYCIDISSTPELDEIRKSLRTFEDLDLEDQKEMLSHLENATSCELRGINYLDKVAKKTLTEMLKALGWGIVTIGIGHFLKTRRRKSMKAATILARTVSNLAHHPSALEAIKTIFGNYPG